MRYKNFVNHFLRWPGLKKKRLDHLIYGHPCRSYLATSKWNGMDGDWRRRIRSHKNAPKECCSSDWLPAKRFWSRPTICLTEAAAARAHITPAGEWLLDNFYLIDEQTRIIKRHLPKGYEKGLPQLRSDFLQGNYPRVYDIALQIIEHGDGRWEPETLSRFIRAYQSVTQLTLGEIWALPIMLRLALIENLGRVSRQILANWSDHQLASSWADRMVEASVSDPKKLVLIIADMVRSEPPMTGAFVAELTRCLQSAALALPLSWIEQKLAEEGLTIETLVQTENTQQAANQATVSNSISSLRRLTEVDWREFVEKMSVVEEILYKDPKEIYRHMDFTTRDRYRHVVERLARASNRPEPIVAATAIHLATLAAENAGENQDPADRTHHSHVGFYLIDDGLPRLQQMLGLRPSVWGKWREWGGKCALSIYLGAIALIAGGFTAAILFKVSHSQVRAGWLVALGIVLLLCISQLAVALVNWLVTLWAKPHPLPKMDFTHGIPAEFRTLVVVPTILSNVADIESQVEALEVRFLGNRDNHLHFALLTDFNDAPEENMPEDAALLALAQEKIAELGRRYRRKSGEEDIFFLLHRPRRWNEREQTWMGFERKRGKLNDLNALLRENDTRGFSLIVGHSEVLAGIKYVITLDSDTQLPRESARQYIGAMAHPLNRPKYDAEKQRVTAGYGILQPRIAEALPSPGPTRYVWLCGTELGIDPYTRTVSNVYQDLFNEGSFTGKGIYDVTLFHNVLSKRFPENQILSHDLLEGCYLRSGFLSDVPLYENSPGNYLNDVKRRHRWIRGDWQIASWVWRKGMSGLSRWKIFDNLRRSLAPIALVVLLILVWTVLPATWFWCGVILALLLLPEVLATLLELAIKPDDMRFSQHVTGMTEVVQRRCYQLMLYLACLPHEAWYSLDAIARTVWRLLISRRHLLEWVPSQPDRS